MGTQNEDSFGWTDYLSALSQESHPEFALGAPLWAEFADIEPVIVGTTVGIVFKPGTKQFVGAMTEAQPTFAALAGGFLFMGNIIQRAQESAIQVSTLTIANEDGTGSASIVAPTGAVIQVKGLSNFYSEHTSDFAISIEESFSIHSNRGAGTVINASLPANAPAGFTTGIARMGPQMNVRPSDAAERIWMPASGYYKLPGESLFMTASGTSAFFTKGSNSDWIPLFPAGTLA